MSEAVQVLSDDHLRQAEGTPGLARRVAFEDEGHWFGRVEAAPETMSGWHHHGNNVTVGYVLKGEVTLEFGRGGRDRVVAKEGDYFEVPRNVVHREGNRATVAGEAIVVRIGDGPVVVPVEGPDPT